MDSGTLNTGTLNSPLDNDTQARDSLRNFTQAYHIVEDNYAETVDPSKAIFEGAIPGMLRVLDPHSTFFDPKAYAQLQEEQSGKYYGIGMSIGARANKIVVIAPFAGTPAYKAGIRPGDVIAAVDGKPTDNMTTDEVADLVRGPKGTNVQITILREGISQPVHLTVMRAEIPRNSVDVHFMLKPGIGYVHLAMFDETTDSELEKALDGFGNLQGLVLDLRQDPGGLLNQAVAVASEFLPKGDVVVSQHGRSSPERVYRVAQGNGGKDYPIVVLVDRGTASAAEIVTGAIQDHDRGIVVGQNTFGKGLVQTVFPLSDSTGLALTTAKYYTPSGRLIQRNYEGVSLYDYYYNVNNNAANNAAREVKKTDTGRLVYGGDGITPDFQIPEPKANAFQQDLTFHYIFFDFAQQYLSQHKITPSWNVDDQTLQDFRNFLHSKNITYSESDFAANLDWVKSHIKAEVFTNSFGLEQGQAASAADDPEVLKAVEYLPQAKNLEETAERIMLERNRSAALHK
ncbi:MAG TPA: S41 family peptidase [Terriglobales bacterium]|nr:S41 family peptidase [Terriglobales bacterium]